MRKKVRNNNLNVGNMLFRAPKSKIVLKFNIRIYIISKICLIQIEY